MRRIAGTLITPLLLLIASGAVASNGHLSPDGTWRVVVAPDPAPMHVDPDPRRIEIRRVADHALLASVPFDGDAADPRPAEARTWALWTEDGRRVAVWVRDRNSTLVHLFLRTSSGFAPVPTPDLRPLLVPSGAPAVEGCWRGHALPDRWQDGALELTFVGVCETVDGGRVDVRASIAVVIRADGTPEATRIPSPVD